MLIKILDNLIYLISNIRNHLLDKQIGEDEFAWMNEAAIEYEKYL